MTEPLSTASRFATIFTKGFSRKRLAEKESVLPSKEAAPSDHHKENNRRQSSGENAPTRGMLRQRSSRKVVPGLPRPITIKRMDESKREAMEEEFKISYRRVARKIRNSPPSSIVEQQISSNSDLSENPSIDPYFENIEHGINAEIIRKNQPKTRSYFQNVVQPSEPPSNNERGAPRSPRFSWPDSELLLDAPLDSAPSSPHFSTSRDSNVEDDENYVGRRSSLRHQSRTDAWNTRMPNTTGYPGRTHPINNREDNIEDHMIKDPYDHYAPFSAYYNESLGGPTYSLPMILKLQVSSPSPQVGLQDDGNIYT